MNRTLRICSWVIIWLGVGMTVFMNFHAMDSVYHPGIFLPLALGPYLVQAVVLKRTTRSMALAANLACALLVLSIGFTGYYYGLFVRFTTLNAFLFVEVPFFQMLPVSAVSLMWLLTRSKQQKRSTS